MHLIKAAEAPRFELPGIEFTALAAPSRGSRELCTWRLTVAPGLTSPEPHTLDHDEVFTVTSGSISLAPDGARLDAGDTAIVPAGTPIQVANPGGEPAEVHVAVRAGFTAADAAGAPISTPPWAT